MGYSSYAQNGACALPSPSPFHYLMAKIVPAMQLATHAKSSTLHGRPHGLKSKCFGHDGLLPFPIIVGYAALASSSAIISTDADFALHYLFCQFFLYPLHPPDWSLNPLEETLLQPVLKSFITVFIIMEGWGIN